MGGEEEWMPHIAKSENMPQRCSPQQENIVDVHAVDNANTTWQTADISTAIYSMYISIYGKSTNNSARDIIPLPDAGWRYDGQDNKGTYICNRIW